VLIGTTNRNQFLVDSTGNRRFVPLEVAPGFEIPWQKLALERDQLWAAAVVAYRRGDLYEFTAGEIAAMSEYIQQFGDPDPWTELITEYLNSREECTAAEILTKALALDHDRQGQRESRRVVEVLQSLGWRRKQTTRKDKITGKRKSVRLWVRPEDDPLDETHILSDF
jgi:predicted P-loop ATPase